jgi:hypothetical protein
MDGALVGAGSHKSAVTLNAQEQQGITNMLVLPIDKMLYIYLLCPHSEHQKNPFQSKESKHFHQKNRFT